jgi:AAHS family 4-hydroxybenzoate transporter-like MFS transporter
MRFVDRFGSIVIAAMPLLAAPLIASLGLDGIGAAGYMAMIFLSGFFILGGHFGITAVGGVFYPSACRAKGYAAATVIGRTGGIIGPFVGGELLSHNIASRQIFAIYGMVPLFLAAAVLGLGLQHRLLMRESRVSL